MNEPWCWTPDQIGRLTLQQAIAIFEKSDPATRSRGYFASHDQAIAAWQARRAAQEADPWGFGDPSGDGMANGLSV